QPKEEEDESFKGIVAKTIHTFLRTEQPVAISPSLERLKPYLTWISSTTEGPVNELVRRLTGRFIQDKGSVQFPQIIPSSPVQNIITQVFVSALKCDRCSEQHGNGKWKID
uniref:Uncharacterized protein n=1 Tax=Pygocentrus nattereri TaxID=42514 RepID=A0AAR2K1F4_PYGNA